MEVKQGKEYLQGRCISDEGIYEKFKIGYADGGLLKMMSVNEKVKSVLRDIGILTKSNTEFFNGYVIFPVIDSKGNCTEIYGRQVNERKGKAKHLYLKGPHKGVWNWEAFKQSREMVITEGIIDALTIYQVGHTEVVPLYGTNGLTKDHLKFFEVYQPDKLYIAFDGDEPGELSVKAVAKRLSKYNIPCYRVPLPHEMDINDYFTSNGHTKVDFDNLLQKSKPVSVELEGVTGNVTVNENLVEFSFGKRIYQVREMNNDNSLKLKVNIRAKVNGSFHVDVFDLYVSKTRKVFTNACARMFNIDSEIIEKDLSGVIEHLEKIRVKKEIKSTEETEKVYEMTQEEEERAVELLKSSDLLNKVVEHLTVCGYVGEKINKMIGYLISISRKLENPLSGVIISNVGAGKSKLMEHVASFVPEEDVIFYTRITPQSLYYKDKRSLKHKLIITCEEEGLTGANYSIRELISSKVLRMAAPVKDPISGKMKTVEYEVEGPVSLLFSTASADINYENATRCFELSLDESREQTKRIQELQRRNRTLDGVKQNLEAEELRNLHKNAQRLLKQLVIVNPYADDLKFPDRWLQSRREHEKYLSLIEAIALLHQYQREIKTMEHRGSKIDYIEITIADIEQANILMTEILGQTLSELKKPSRELILLTKKMVDEQCEKLKTTQDSFKFNRRDIREYTGWSDYQVRTHIKQLEDLQYIIPVMGNRGKMYKYELAYDGAGKSEKFIPGLTDVSKLRKKHKLRG